MFRLKNLVPRGVLIEENYNVLRKKSEEYKRSINFFTGHIHQIVQIYIDYYELFENNLNDVMSEINANKEASCQLYSEILLMFCAMNGELQKFIEKASMNEKSLIELSNLFITDYNILVESFQSRGRDYFQMEEKVIHACKKYFSVYQEMLNKIEAYKVSFMDVKLIYNNDQKIRLYRDCLDTYKELSEFAKANEEKVDKLNKAKFVLIDSYKILGKQLTNFTISFASRYIEELRKFFQYLFGCIGNQLQIFIDKNFPLEKSSFASLFETAFNLQNQELLSCEVVPEKCKIIPSFILYSEKLTEEGRTKFKRCLFLYLSQMYQRSDKRRKTTRRVVDMLKWYVRGIQKYLLEWIRQTLNSFEKMRKKIGESFGNRWIGFYKIIAAIFQNSIENTGRLVIRTNAVIQKLENFVSQESNLMGDFVKELRSYVEQNVPKKFFKKYSFSSEIKWEEISKEERETSNEDISHMSQYLTHLIERYKEASSFAYDESKASFLDFMACVRQSLSEYFIFFNELQTTYYNEEEYAKSYRLFQEDMSESVKRGMLFFDEIQLAEIVRESAKVVFDGEFHKIDAFKKIKKPKQFDENERHNKSMRVLDVSVESINKTQFMGEAGSKNAQFLFKKLDLQPNQRYVKSYSCSLSDTIILAGRLYITTHRLCFHSKFNTKNLFFGQTLIEIPSKDIKKIEKRSMNLLSDHAIAITTVNGEVVFRSFFSRDNCYNNIKKIFEVNEDDIFFEEEEQDQGRTLIEEQVEFQDDMNEEAAKERQNRLQKQLKEFDYKLISEEEFCSVGLTVVKFLKLFELDQEVVMNRIPFSSFLSYFKDRTGNREISVNPWIPNPLEYLNVLNIKEDSPQVFTRKVSAVAPLPPSPIPFMPKTSLTTEEHALFLMGKNRVMIQSIIKSSGVPYSDTFQVRLKKVIESSGQNRVKVSCSIFFNFFQSVIVRSTIQSKGFQATKQNLTLQSEQIRSYLRQLQKKMSRGDKKETAQQRIKHQQDQIEELERELKQNQESKNQVEKINGQLKEKLTRYKQIGVILGVIVLVELMALIL